VTFALLNALGGLTAVEFDHLVHRLTTGLVRVAVAADRSGPPDLERTIAQQQALLLLARRPQEYSLSSLSTDLGMPMPAAQTALATLCREGLVSMEPSPSYSPHDMRVELTEHGRAQAPEFLNWADALLTELEELGEDDQRRLLQFVTNQIFAMQRRGEIPITKMCVTCRFFDGYAHVGTTEPHHCRLVDAPFGYRELRLRCPEQQQNPKTDP
jgi:DNA-binding MarR family transcriptional regulator